MYLYSLCSGIVVTRSATTPASSTLFKEALCRSSIHFLRETMQTTGTMLPKLDRLEQLNLLEFL